jgi:hypothetical protein
MNNHLRGDDDDQTVCLLEALEETGSPATNTRKAQRRLKRPHPLSAIEISGHTVNGAVGVRYRRSLVLTNSTISDTVGAGAVVDYGGITLTNSGISGNSGGGASIDYVYGSDVVQLG